MIIFEGILKFRKDLTVYCQSLQGNDFFEIKWKVNKKLTNM